MKSHLKLGADTTFSNLSGGKPLHEEHMRSLMFGDYMDTAVEDKSYDEVTDLDAFTAIVQSSIEEYNNVNKTPMDLVIFRYVLEHLSRVSRVLKQPGGHALLVGVGGSGRQSLTRLAAAVADYAIFQPEITKQYGVAEWKEDLKSVLTQAGGQGRHTVLLFNDTQIKFEAMLQDIDSLLNTGEVANLFAADEKANLTEMVRPAAQADNPDADLGPMQLFSYFTGRVKDRLHIVLCFSPIGSAFRSRLRMFPSLVNCCTINWFQTWPSDALQRVAQTFLRDVELEEAERAGVVTLCQYFHESVRALSLDFEAKLKRHNYVTPTSYLELVKCFKGLLQSKRDDNLRVRSQYVTGLEKLEFASQQVAIMQGELEELQPQLVEASELNAKMMVQIDKDSKEAAVIEQAVKKDEAEANEKAAVAQGEKDECEALLAEAIPALEAAVAALNTLKKADIDLVKSMKNPPAGVKLVMEAVCVMKAIKPERVNDPAGSGKKVDDYWGPSKKVIGDLKVS